MAAEQSQSSLEIQISNKTKNITLKNPRTLVDQISTTLRPQLPPGSSDSCRFSNNPADIVGLLIYEAESFTLAILVTISPNPDTCPHVLQLELSLDKAHQGEVGEMCFRMWSGWDLPNAHKNTVSRCEFPGTIRGTITMNAGPVKVRATVSQEPSYLLKVVLAERGNSEEDLQPLESICRIL